MAKAARAIILATAALASCAGRSGHAGRPGHGLDVHVVDERGAPLPGLKVSAGYQTMPGPIASTCCFWIHLGEAVTGTDGVAWLPQPPANSGLEVSVARPGWPARTVRWPGIAGLVLAPGPLTVVLGPPRDLAGRVELGDCVPGFLDVWAAPAEAGRDAKPVTAGVGDDGRFVVHGLGPGKHRLALRACGREARAEAEATGKPASPEPVLVLPPRDPRRPSYPAAPRPAAQARAVVPAKPPPPVPCAPATGALVIAGDFDELALDRRCRFVLAGRDVVENRYQAATWTLVRPGRANLPLGTADRFPGPTLGERLALLSPPGDRISARVVDLETGAREEIGPVRRHALGAGDAVVLAGAGAPPGYGDTTLDVRWPDGRRQRLGDRVADNWSLVGDERFLIYGIRSGQGTTEAHALDLTTRRDRLLARDARSTWSFASGADVVVQAGVRLLAWDLATGGEGRLVADPAAGWWPLGPDLLVKGEDQVRVEIWRRGDLRLLPVALSRSSNVDKLRATADHLLLGADGDAVLVDLATGGERLLAEGVAHISVGGVLLAHGSLTLNEASGRVLLAPLDGRPARAVGRGTARSVSPDGAWLAIESDFTRMGLAPADGPGPSMQVSARGGAWLPDAPVFLHTGPASYFDPRPLYAVFPARQRTVTVEARVVRYLPLPAGEALVVVPRGGARAPGVWRVRIPEAP
jgi:hypothetical protein